MFGLTAVIFNRLLKRLERVDRLLEYFNYRNPPYIFRSRFRHAILSRLIFRHQLGIFTSHHGEHGNY